LHLLTLEIYSFLLWNTYLSIEKIYQYLGHILKGIICFRFIIFMIKWTVIFISTSLPYPIRAIRPSTNNHFTIHIEFHSLNFWFFIMTSKNSLSFTSSIIKKND
jgi:hypothetical protein